MSSSINEKVSFVYFNCAISGNKLVGHYKILVSCQTANAELRTRGKMAK
jgi:hypothetical protein